MDALTLVSEMGPGKAVRARLDNSGVIFWLCIECAILDTQKDESGWTLTVAELPALPAFSNPMRCSLCREVLRER